MQLNSKIGKTISILLLLLFAYSVVAYRDKLIIENPIIDTVFDHALHKEEPCANCHHNYVDGSEGFGGCYDCHKYTAKINRDIEATFHDFCLDCHIKKAHEQEKFGPLRQCSVCHEEDQIID